MLRVLALLTAAALLAGCSDRQRLNPLDPGNPATGGRPAGFVALAGDGTVTLQWAPSALADVAGYVISRRAAPDSAYRTLISLAGARLGLFHDTGRPNGVEAGYRLQYRFADGRLSQPAEDLATPGPLRVWVTDYAARTLQRVTPDARHVTDRATALFEGPTDVDARPSSGLVWACDPLLGRVVIHNPGGVAPGVVSGLLEPVAVAVDPGTGDGWICDAGLQSLFRFDPARTTAPEVEIGGLAEPLSVAVDAADGSVWVCERSGSRVRHFTRDGSPLASVAVGDPSRVAVDSLTRGVWVTSFTRREVVRIFGGAVVATIGGFAGPIGIAVDPRRGRVWVADSFAGRLHAFDRAGAPLFTVPGLTEVREIAIDRATGEAWVTLPGPGQVVRLSADGAILGRVTGLGQPIDIAAHTF
jgi:DNA-binding beta-propeller fold protein YncE